MVFGKIKKYGDLSVIIKDYPYEENIAGFLSGMPAIFEELYPNANEEVKALYLKNIINEKENEAIFFFDDKIVSVTKSDLNFNISEYRGKIQKKEFFIHRKKEMHRHTYLKVFLDSGDVVLLDNKEDANEEFFAEFGNEIKDIAAIL